MVDLRRQGQASNDFYKTNWNSFMSKTRTKSLPQSIVPAILLALVTGFQSGQSHAQEIMTHCERYGAYDPDCPAPGSKPQQKQEHNPAASNATSYVVLCNTTPHTLTMSLVYDQSGDRRDFRINDHKYMAAGWLRIESNSCDSGFEVGNGQWTYFAFKEAGGRSALNLLPKNYPITGQKRVKTICVDYVNGFSKSSDNLSELTTNCASGLNPLQTSFGIQGGTNNLKLNLVLAD